MSNYLKTLLVGIDAACWEYLEPLLSERKLPVIQGLIETGVSGNLASTLPAWTPTAWASIITGKNPGKHGVYGMMVRKSHAYEFTPTNASIRKGTPFWKRLNDAGIRTGLINVPFSHPPDDIEGFIVCGFGAPAGAPDLIRPADAMPAIVKACGCYAPGFDDALLNSGTQEEIVAAEHRHQSTLIEIAMTMLDRYEVDVLVINLMLLDHVNHYSSDMSLVRQAICQSDADLAVLQRRFRPDNIILISDHGSRRTKGAFLLHEWLLAHGYCRHRIRDRTDQKAAANNILVKWLKQEGLTPGPLEKLTRFVLREAISYCPHVITRLLWSRIEQALPFAHRYTLLSNKIDYANSCVFAESQYSGLLYLNVIGRDPAGIVPVQEVPRVRRQLVDALSMVKDPDTGSPLFAKVYFPEQLYSGELLSRAPDVILDAYDANWSVFCSHVELPRGRIRDRFFVEGLGDLGQHSRTGILVCSGPAFRQGSIHRTWSVVDIPSTLLYLYNIPLPDDYDGLVIEDVIDQEILERSPVQYQAGDDSDEVITKGMHYEAGQADALVARLRALGYVS